MINFHNFTIQLIFNILFALRFLLFCILIITFVLSGCYRSRIPSKGTVNAKIIEYRIEYLAEKAGSIPTNVLPGKMTLIFAEQYALNRIEGFLGQFSLSYIANRRTKTVTSLLKIFDNKYYYTGKPGELPCGIDSMQDIIMEKTGRKKDIAGFASDEFRITKPEGDNFFIYSAKIDHIKNPNITTPYREIDAVLLEFYTSLSVLKMKLSASRYYSKEVEWNIFNIPEEYIEVSDILMNKAIDELFR